MFWVGVLLAVENAGPGGYWPVVAVPPLAPVPPAVPLFSVEPVPLLAVSDAPSDAPFSVMPSMPSTALMICTVRAVSF